VENSEYQVFDLLTPLYSHKTFVRFSSDEGEPDKEKGLREYGELLHN
jgi:hypothetical protein